nr:hypothetical protein [Sphingomonas sp. CDS-1]
MSKGQQTLRDDAKRTITYGGPNNQFEISADRNGNRTIREVPEFTRAAREERAAKNAPSFKDMQDRRARVIYQIGTLPEKVQREAAYADVIANPQSYGIDARGMPPEWDDTYGTVAGNSGMTVSQAWGNGRADLMAGWKMQDGDKKTAQGAHRLELAKTKDARAALKASLPKPPPSVTRKGAAKMPTGFILD